MITPSDAADKVFKMVSHAEKYGGLDVDVVVFNGEPWFCAKQVALVLKYAKPANSIDRFVKDQNKAPLGELILKFGVPVTSTLTHNQKTSLYINEAGLYRLIMKSRLPAAEKFQEWISDELLPRIRKIGKDAAMNALNEANQKLEAQLEESKKKLERQSRGAAQIKQFMENAKMREQNERIYIAFCPLDAKANIFKVGGCQSENHLPKRLCTYNSAQSNDNLYMYSATWNCHRYAEVEARIKQVISEFRQKGKQEVYMMHYTKLYAIIDYTVRTYNEATTLVNEVINSILHDMTEREPVVPEPMLLIRKAIEPALIKIEDLTIEEQESLLERLLVEFLKRNPGHVKRAKFEEFVYENGVKKFKRKKPIWEVVVGIAKRMTNVIAVY